MNDIHWVEISEMFDDEDVIEAAYAASSNCFELNTVKGSGGDKLICWYYTTEANTVFTLYEVASRGGHLCGAMVTLGELHYNDVLADYIKYNSDLEEIA